MTENKCGSCYLCCKIPKISALNKPEHVLCKNYETGTGCKIYPTRPNDCRVFKCGWLRGLIPEKFKPHNVGFYFGTLDENGFFNIFTEEHNLEKTLRTLKKMKPLNFPMPVKGFTIKCHDNPQNNYCMLINYTPIIKGTPVELLRKQKGAKEWGLYYGL
jgi:hypothetical protein